MNSEMKDKLTDIIYSYRKAQLLYIAAKLGIADILLDGPLSSRDISKKTGTDEDTLYRVLRALASFGIFNEKENKFFESTVYSKLLVSEHPSRLNKEIIMRMEEYNWKPWGELLYSVKTGKSAFKKIFGMNLFKYLSENLQASQTFNECMDIYSEVDADNIIRSYDFSVFDKIADIGGGYGKLLIKILKKYKKIKGVLFDMHTVIDEKKRNEKAIKNNERIELISGDFFKAVPSDCDLYILRRIIHDWNDRHALKILKNCYKASVKGSRILLIEQVISNGISCEKVMLNDIHMLVQTIEGRERTEEEYRILLNKAGYKLNKVEVNYIEGIK